MKEIILIKNGELALKGLNRSTFESILVKNISRRLSGLGEWSIRKAQSAIYIEPQSPDIDMNRAVTRLKKVFGIVGLSRACVTVKDIEQIKLAAAQYLQEPLLLAKTFKVEGKRADKSFPLKSPEICVELGEHLLINFPHLSVDVHNPDVTVTVEIRDFGAYIRTDQMPGAGGMPVGTGGKAMVLISGGIDSPVAAYMLAKRGVELYAVHFASPPYTSTRAEQKVHDLLRKVSEYAGSIQLFTVPFTEIQEQIADKCPGDLTTLIMRRYMMRIAGKIAKAQECHALITGESLGQVASQTIHALECTDAAAELPVFRPVIGMDKQEIISIARRIETFDISILPYEDCCTVFTPKHPRTRPKLSMLLDTERALPSDELIDKALAGTGMKLINAM